jgi:hypothetical protein
MQMTIARPSLQILVALGALVSVAILASCQTAASPSAAPTAPKAAASPAGPSAASPAAGTASQLRDLNKYLDESVEALQKNDVAKAKQEYEEFDEGWERVEDGVRAQSTDLYRKIEDAMGEVKGTLVTPATPDTAKATDALKKLKKTVEDALPSLR